MTGLFLFAASASGQKKGGAKAPPSFVQDSED
jgi:hypothetical protein